MEMNSIRLIPFVFDKLFSYTAPADAMVCRNACKAFDQPAYRQVRYRLLTPKKRMLLLAWPFCMHAGEHASNFDKQGEFYDIFRANVMRTAARFRRHNDIVNEQMRKFLAGFESFMLHCVLSNTDLYSELNILMLDFHSKDFHVFSCFNDILQTERIQGFLSKSLVQVQSLFEWNAASEKPSLFMDANLWSKVINTLVAQCASTLRHFVFCSSLWLPEQFYTNLKLDRMLAQLQHLETLYMPSFEKCEQAHTSSGSQGSCWQALIDLPPGERLPSLRRVVAEHTLDSNERVVFSDAGNNVGTRFVKLLSSTTLPQFHYLSPKLAIELVRPKFDGLNHDMEQRVQHLLPNFACYVRDSVYNLTLSQRTIDYHMYYHYYQRDVYNKFDDIPKCDIPKFIDAVETSLLEVGQHRLQMMSVINDVRIDRGQKVIPACIDMKEFALVSTPETVKLVLNALSRVSWPLSLTLEFDWRYLLKHLSLFMVTPTTNKQEDDAASLTTKCFLRGKLKLRLTIEAGLQQGMASEFRYSKMMHTPVVQLRAENRYKFPLQGTIKFQPRRLEIKFGKNDSNSSIREHFTNCMREFVNDVTGDNPVFDKDTDAETLAAIHASSKNLRADLYSSCHMLIISLDVSYRFPHGVGFKDTVRKENRRRVEELLNGKQLEQELLCELYAKLSEEEDERQQIFVLPNLKSILFERV